MIIPGYLKSGGTIGVTAMSHSIDNMVDHVRFNNAKKTLEEKDMALFLRTMCLIHRISLAGAQAAKKRQSSLIRG